MQIIRPQHWKRSKHYLKRIEISVQHTSNGQLKAMTLIEVVASLVIVATTGTALLLAQSQSIAQLTATNEQKTAARLATHLILIWKIDPAPLGSNIEGQFEDQSGWKWQRQTKPRMGTVQPNLIDVTLEIYRYDDSGQRNVVTSYTWIEVVDEP